jgi:cyclophilin family peptidyl-prolyl cis-trans isomerase/predicted small lipoprotein YifL
MEIFQRHQIRRALAILLSCGLASLAGCGQAEPGNVPTAAANSPETSVYSPGKTSPDSMSVKKFDSKYPEVVLETTLGPITLRLDAEKAPLTVGNFLNYVERGHYNGTIVHEVHKNFIALLGGYTENLKERTGDFPIRNEAANGLENKRYSVAMARLPQSIDSATTHFFINLHDNKSLNHSGKDADKFGFCVFGEVIAGREIVDQLNSVSTTAKQDFPALPATTIAVQNVKRIK